MLTAGGAACYSATIGAGEHFRSPAPVLVAQAVGDEIVSLDEPFPVTLSPRQLVR